MFLISKGDRSGFAWYMRAATPAAPGVAILVPLNPTYPSPELASADITSDPTKAMFGLILPSSVGPCEE